MAVSHEASAFLQGDGEGSQRALDSPGLQQQFGVADVTVEEPPQRGGIAAEAVTDHVVFAQRLPVTALGFQGRRKVGPRGGKSQGLRRGTGSLVDVDDDTGQ